MGFPRQAYWGGLPCPPQGSLANPGIELASLMFPLLADGFFTTSATWEAQPLGEAVLISFFLPPTGGHGPEQRHFGLIFR